MISKHHFEDNAWKLLQLERNGIMCMNLNACLNKYIIILSYAINHYFYTLAAIISKDRYYTHSLHILDTFLH